MSLNGFLLRSYYENKKYITFIYFYTIFSKKLGIIWIQVNYVEISDNIYIFTYPHGIISSRKIWVLYPEVYILAHKHHQPELTNLQDRLCAGRRTIYIRPLAKRSTLRKM